MAKKNYVTLRMTREEALILGLLTCTCGHPVNNHFLPSVRGGVRPCAHCACSCYHEKARVGELQYLT